jgi:hypothetical protein
MDRSSQAVIIRRVSAVPTSVKAEAERLEKERRAIARHNDVDAEIWAWLFDLLGGTSTALIDPRGEAKAHRHAAAAYQRLSTRAGVLTRVRASSSIAEKGLQGELDDLLAKVETIDAPHLTPVTGWLVRS